MTTHILNFGYTTGQTLTAQLFAIGSDAVVATASSVSEATNRKGRYAATFEDVVADDYLMVYFIDGSAAGSEYFTIAGIDGESVLPWSENPAVQAAAVLAAAVDSPIRADLRKVNGEEPQPVDDVATLSKQVEILAGIAGIAAGDIDLSSLESLVRTMASESTRIPSPNVNGNLVLVSGDTYDGIGNDKASWITDADYTDGWAVMLTIRDADDEVVMEVVGEVASESLVTVPLTGPSDLEYRGCPGRWQGKFDVQLSKGTSRKTIALGECYVSEDQTR